VTVDDINDPSMARAIAHPVRVKILSLLEQGDATPKYMAQQLELRLENLSYHVRALAKAGFIELTGTRQVRGAVEHRYRLKLRPRISKDAWANMPEIVKSAMTGAALTQVFEIAASAAEQDKFTRPESHVSRRPAMLDEAGFREASRVLSEALDRISEIEDEARARIEQDGSSPVPAVAVALLFDAPEETKED
jgi:DNA-binding transcriptional ArsR family regulator